MIKQYKLMIFVNILLGLLFLVVNYVYYYFANRFDGHGVLWSPLWLNFYNFSPTADDVGAQEPNFGFYFFWILMIVNVYSIYLLQKSKETKQS
jgi:hypothetical protein